MPKNTLLIEQSATMAINSLLLQKKQQGELIYNLSVGETIINTSQEIVKAAHDALLKNKTYYTPIGGIIELKSSATNWLNRIYKTDYSIDEVIITCGGKHALFMALQTLLLPKDEVIIISPYWVSYPNIVKLFKGDIWYYT